MAATVVLGTSPDKKHFRSPLCETSHDRKSPCFFSQIDVKLNPMPLWSGRISPQQLGEPGNIGNVQSGKRVMEICVYIYNISILRYIHLSTKCHHCSKNGTSIHTMSFYMWAKKFPYERHSAAGNVSEFDDACLRGLMWVYGFTRVYAGLRGFTRVDAG